MNYYTLYIKQILSERDDSHATDLEFIDSRSKAASEEYERQRRHGLDVNQSHELAMSTLLVGI